MQVEDEIKAEVEFPVSESKKSFKEDYDMDEDDNTD